MSLVFEWLNMCDFNKSVRFCFLSLITQKTQLLSQLIEKSSPESLFLASRRLTTCFVYKTYSTELKPEL